jgi:hypothetical protein
MPSGKELRSEQRRERRMAFHIDADVGGGSILVGDPQATMVRNGVGDYTLTFRNAYGRAPILVGSGAEADARVIMGTSTVSSIQILIEDSAAAPQDYDVIVDVIGWDSSDEI